MFLPGLLACTLASEPATCDAPDCRVDAVVEAWGRSPEQGLVALEQLPHDAEKVAAVERLVGGDPEAMREWCERLPEGAPRMTCNRGVKRPHLVTEPLPRQGRQAQRDARGPGRAMFAPAEGVLSRFAGIEGRPDGCATDACLADEARGAARAGDAESAARRCAAVLDDEARDECAFRAAEAMVDETGLDAYSGAVELCLLTDGFLVSCLRHLMPIVARDTPPAATEPAEWAPVLTGAEHIRALWADRDPIYGDYAVQQYWALSTFVAHKRSDPVAGNLLDVLPAEALPHLRAAATWRMFELGEAEGRDLAGVVALHDAAMKRRLSPDQGNPGDGTVRGVEVLWLHDEGDEDEIRATVYLNNARRAVSADPAVDAVICVLEAAARQESIRSDLLEQGLAHPDPLVQWTARRLLDEAGRRTAEDGR